MTTYSIDSQSLEECELKYGVEVTLMNLGVRSFMVKISVCWVITCNIVGTLFLKMESIIFRFNQSDIKHQFQIDLIELIILNLWPECFIKESLKLVYWMKWDFKEYKNNQWIKLCTLGLRGSALKWQSL
jgi:hypothetical protein